MIGAIEVGGTFTDVVLVDEEGRVRIHKVPSTPSSPGDAAILGLRECLDASGHRIDEIGELLHGSTVAANLLIERRESPTAVVVTEGFRDILAIQRASKGSVYGMHFRKPKPLVDSMHVFEVRERISASGEIVEPLDDDRLAAIVHGIVERGYRSVAVCLMHSYANGSHERRVAEALVGHPGLYVTLSSDIAPEYREYERMSTTVVDAFLRPEIESYLTTFSEQLRQLGYAGSPLIMQSNGGVVPVEKAKKHAANMFLSGPAAAASGAALFARHAGMPRLISIDVGGTSTDLCLIDDGQPATTVNGTSHYSVHGHPLNLMMTDIVTIGAGGGSIAQTDRGGLLTVGPRSAGAHPGPACYGRGGQDFTLSDAMLLLGLLDEAKPLPGGILLRPDRAASAAMPLCDRFGLTPAELSARVFRIAAVNMAHALRGISVKRGFDPREYTLFPCGGVGPMIAAAVAEELGIPEVVVPPHPGTFSALGLALADLRVDYVQGDRVTASGELDRQRFVARFDAMKRQALLEFESFGIAGASLRFVYMVDARYRGQGYELRVALPEPDVIDGDPSTIDEHFHELHARLYGLSFRGRPIDVVSFRLSASCPRAHAAPDGPPEHPPRTLRGSEPGPRGSGGWPVLDRAALPPDEGCIGPLRVVEPTTTTVVPAGWRVRYGADSTLRLSRERPARRS